MAAAEDVRLLGFWPSPYAMRPQIALKLKKVEYEFVVETMNPKSELLLKSNPAYKKIPVLFHNGNPVCESLVIVHYIDEAWPSGKQILPADPYDRAVARFWAAYIDDKWFPAMLGIAKAKTDEERASSTEQMLAGLQLLEGAFATYSKGKPAESRSWTRPRPRSWLPGPSASALLRRRGGEGGDAGDGEASGVRQDDGGPGEGRPRPGELSRQR